VTVAAAGIATAGVAAHETDHPAFNAHSIACWMICFYNYSGCHVPDNLIVSKKIFLTLNIVFIETYL
jgi:hypothetical protein